LPSWVSPRARSRPGSVTCRACAVPVPDPEEAQSQDSSEEHR
jgi:hypothetical protein